MHNSSPKQSKVRNLVHRSNRWWTPRSLIQFTTLWKIIPLSKPSRLMRVMMKSMAEVYMLRLTIQIPKKPWSRSRKKTSKKSWISKENKHWISERSRISRTKLQFIKTMDPPRIKKLPVDLKGLLCIQWELPQLQTPQELLGHPIFLGIKIIMRVVPTKRVYCSTSWFLLSKSKLSQIVLRKLLQEIPL